MIDKGTQEQSTFKAKSFKDLDINFNLLEGSIFSTNFRLSELEEP